MYYNKIDIKSVRKDYSKAASSLAVEFVQEKAVEKQLKTLLVKYNINISILQKTNFLDKKGRELFIPNPESGPDYLYIYKLPGGEDKLSVDYFRNLFAGLIPRLHKLNIKSLQVYPSPYSQVRGVFENTSYYYQTIIEGVLLGNYRFNIYKSVKDSLSKLSVNIKPEEEIKLGAIIRKAGLLVESVYFTRDLVNEPAITLTPQEFAIRTKQELTGNGVKVRFIKKAELKKLGMNSVLAVGEASDNPPLMMVLEYKPKVKAKRKVALVGKGVTYDSGGLSIKPTNGMIEMNADMAGGGTVVGIINAAASLQLPVHLIGVVPAVENMVSGRSYKPGDIIKSYSGKTIEVKDTDAEGRIVLADALHYASKQKPDEIIDFATLTGAVVVALGLPTAGIFTKNDNIADALLASGKKVNEPVWRLPFDDYYNTLIESDIADVSNLGPRWGSAITAGKFLEHFVDKKIPYCHIDLAGPALKHKFTSYTEKYDTGFGVRLVIDYLSKL